MISFPCLFPDPPYFPTHSIPWFLSLSLENKQKEKKNKTTWTGKPG